MAKRKKTKKIFPIFEDKKSFLLFLLLATAVILIFYF